VAAPVPLKSKLTKIRQRAHIKKCGRETFPESKKCLTKRKKHHIIMR
jgi:hypothetical protein